MKVAIGVTTYNRPKFLAKSLRALNDNLRGLEAPVWVCNDGSGPKYSAEYRRAYTRFPGATIIECPENRGVAAAKNTLLRMMLDVTNADWFFLLEDDIEITSSKAISAYVDAAEEFGTHHLSFAHHGPANAQGPTAIEGQIEFYPHSIGAWCLYSRHSLEEAGLFDENFHNAWEHVEHELRLIQQGLMPGAGPHRFPDVAGSAGWLRELPNSIEKSAIRPRSDWQASIAQGLAYWRQAKPSTFDAMFGAGTPLESYARGILGDVD